MSNSYSVFSSFENLRGIVRQAKDRKRANSVVTKLSKSRGKRTVRQRFFNQNKVALFHFLLLPITTEAMGIWRFAGAFAVVKRQSECGNKTAGMHVSQPVPIGVCYGQTFCTNFITHFLHNNKNSRFLSKTFHGR